MRGSLPTGLRVLTINANSWSTLRELLLDEVVRDAHMLLIQETHLITSRIPDAQNQAAKKGWQSAFAPARPTEAGRTSGGVAILWRGQVAIQNKPVILAEARALQVSVWVREVGPIQVICIYADVNAHPEQTSERLQHIVGKVRSLPQHANLLIGGISTRAQPTFTAGL